LIFALTPHYFEVSTRALNCSETGKRKLRTLNIRTVSIWTVLRAAIYAIALNALFATHSHAAEGKKVTLTGEMIDTWCYVSQIMGSSEVVTGTAHHVCAVWCAAGGIPVGLLNKADQKVYMILSFEGDDTSVANEKILNLQSRA